MEARSDERTVEKQPPTWECGRDGGVELEMEEANEVAERLLEGGGKVEETILWQEEGTGGT